MSNLDQLNSEIQQTQARLNRLQTERASLEAAIADVESSRPAGIPLSWKPYFEGSPPNLIIYAWFDPTKFGDRFAITPAAPTR